MKPVSPSSDTRKLRQDSYQVSAMFRIHERVFIAGGHLTPWTSIQGKNFISPTLPYRTVFIIPVYLNFYPRSTHQKICVLSTTCPRSFHLGPTSLGLISDSTQLAYYPSSLSLHNWYYNMNMDMDPLPLPLPQGISEWM